MTTTSHNDPCTTPSSATAVPTPEASSTVSPTPEAATSLRDSSASFAASTEDPRPELATPARDGSDSAAASTEDLTPELATQTADGSASSGAPHSAAAFTWPEPVATAFGLTTSGGNSDSPAHSSPTDTHGTFVVTGGPGSGRTTLVEQICINHIRAGVHPDRIVILTASKSAAAASEARIMEVLREQRVEVSSGHIARSVHSFAFALLRAAAMRRGIPEPRLLTGAEHDAAVQEMLSQHAEAIRRAGESSRTHAASDGTLSTIATSADEAIRTTGYSSDGANSLEATAPISADAAPRTVPTSADEAPRTAPTSADAAPRTNTVMPPSAAQHILPPWPQRLHAALPTVGMARQLRDLLLRAAERGVTPTRLIALGQEYSRDEWEAAGHFAQEFAEVMALRGEEQINASELVRRAVEEAEADPRLLDLLDIEVILVDDAHHMDPLSSALIDLCRQRARLCVVTADALQTVFHFRGASTAYIEKLATTSTPYPNRRGATGSITTLHLPGTHRLPAAIARLASGVALATGQPEGKRWADEVRGAMTAQTPEADLSTSSTWGNTAGATLHVCDSPGAERTAVVDRVCRAHLADGVEWSDIAVLVRDSNQIPSVRRALLRAGVPVTESANDMVLSEQPLVRALLQVILMSLEASGQPLPANSSVDMLRRTATAEALLCGPMGGADSVTYRRLLRAVRRAYTAIEIADPDLATQLLEAVWLPTSREANEEPYFRAADALHAMVMYGDIEQLSVHFTPREAELIGRVQRVMAATHAALRHHLSVEMVLWEAWSAAGIAESLRDQALRGGAIGSVANRHLDAVMALFDAAGDYVERRPQAGVGAFVEYIVSQQLPVGTRAHRGSHLQAVEILAAHSAVGREWDTVVVAGVQEGVWPSTTITGTIFKQSELTDLLDRNIEPGQAGARVARVAERIAEERRLFLVALTRATRSLLVTAVGVESAEDADDDESSRFLRELDLTALSESTPQPEATLDTSRSIVDEQALWAHPGIPHSIDPTSLISELRGYATDANQSETLRREAAWQLARLAEASQDYTSAFDTLAPARPANWWGIVPISSTAPLRLPTAPVELSPSKLERLATCALRSAWEEVAGDHEYAAAPALGQLMHAAAEALEKGVDIEVIRTAIASTMPRLSDVAPALLHHDLQRWMTAVDSLAAYMQPEKNSGVPVYNEMAFQETLCQVHITAHGEITVTSSLYDGVIDAGQSSATWVSELAGDDRGGVTFSIVVRGRMDRVVDRGFGIFEVDDYKTSKHIPSVAETQQHIQLLTYQVAIALAAARQAARAAHPGAPSAHPGAPSATAAGTNPTDANSADAAVPTTQPNARQRTHSLDALGAISGTTAAKLVYPLEPQAKNPVTIREQKAWDTATAPEAVTRFAGLALQLASDRFTATPDDKQCVSCAFSYICPAQHGAHTVVMSEGEY